MRRMLVPVMAVALLFAVSASIALAQTPPTPQPMVPGQPVGPAPQQPSQAPPAPAPQPGQAPPAPAAPQPGQTPAPAPQRPSRPAPAPSFNYLVGPTVPHPTGGRFPDVTGLKPYTPETNNMSLPGFLRYLTFQQTGVWISQDDAEQVVRQELSQ